MRYNIIENLDQYQMYFLRLWASYGKEPNRFQQLKEIHPKIWEYCMKPWEEGGLGMKEVLDYVHVKYE